MGEYSDMKNRGKKMEKTRKSLMGRYANRLIGKPLALETEVVYDTPKCMFMIRNRIEGNITRDIPNNLSLIRELFSRLLNIAISPNSSTITAAR